MRLFQVLPARHPCDGIVAHVVREAGLAEKLRQVSTAVVAYRWSHRLRPSWPLELAMPVGQSRDLEFSMIRALSMQEAATTTRVHGLHIPACDSRSMYATPDA